jgi:hypothetical protein
MSPRMSSWREGAARSAPRGVPGACPRSAGSGHAGPLSGHNTPEARLDITCDEHAKRAGRPGGWTARRRDAVTLPCGESLSERLPERGEAEKGAATRPGHGSRGGGAQPSLSRCPSRCAHRRCLPNVLTAAPTTAHGASTARQVSPCVTPSNRAQSVRLSTPCLTRSSDDRRGVSLPGLSDVHHFFSGEQSTR